MHFGYAFLHFMLVGVFIWAFVHGSPVSDDADISGSFNDQFDVNLRDDGLPLRRVHHRYLYKRDLHHELFEPRADLQFDVLLGIWMMFSFKRVSLIILQATVCRHSISLTAMHHTSTWSYLKLMACCAMIDPSAVAQTTSIRQC
jgi:hypothetical protein